MGYMCDFCGEQRSMVYCRSDAASLCLSCDRNVHSANALSKRHSRTLICEKCNAQPASVRCSDERVSLCQNCDWLGHDSADSSHHKRQNINCYSGCPSSSELASIWSFCMDLDFSSGGGQSACEQELGLMTIDDGKGVDEEQPETSSAPQGNGIDHPSVPEDSSMAKEVGVCKDDFYGNLMMDGVDLALEKYEDFFGMSFNSSKDLFDHGGIGSLFDKLSAPEKPAESNVESADSFMSCRTEPIICYSSKPADTNISFSSVAGESIAVDFQDCGASTMQQQQHSKEPPPWCTSAASQEISASLQAATTTRNNAVLRYREKKKARKFDKRVRYVSRKERADVRRRVKGRFVKSGEAYDYDPMSPARSY